MAEPDSKMSRRVAVGMIVIPMLFNECTQRTIQENVCHCADINCAFNPERGVYAMPIIASALDEGGLVYGAGIDW